MTTLNIFIAQRFDGAAQGFTDADAAAVSSHITDFFKKVCEGTGFGSASVFRNPVVTQIGASDLLCYLVSSPERSIAISKGATSLGPGGTTIPVASGSGVLSEAYLSACAGDSNRNKLLANLIMHELMHNKLDARPGKVMVDVHKIPGGAISKDVVTSGMSPSDADIKAMRRGVSGAVAQYTGGL